MGGQRKLRKMVTFAEHNMLTPVRRISAVRRHFMPQRADVS
jgi:hypothetical protein